MIISFICKKLNFILLNSFIFITTLNECNHYRIFSYLHQNKERLCRSSLSSSRIVSSEVPFKSCPSFDFSKKVFISLPMSLVMMLSLGKVHVLFDSTAFCNGFFATIFNCMEVNFPQKGIISNKLKYFANNKNYSFLCNCEDRNLHKRLILLWSERIICIWNDFSIRKLFPPTIIFHVLF